MEQEIQPKSTGQSKKCIFVVISSILLTSLIVGLVVGLVVYFWQNYSLGENGERFRKQNEIFQQRITDIENYSKNEIEEYRKLGQYTDNLESYSNSYYGFSISFPKGRKICLNDFCENNTMDRQLGYFSAPYSNQVYLEIVPYKNSLGMSAVDFAKRSLELNRKYEQDGHTIYSDEKISQFAGEKAYEFTATGGFEQRGAMIRNGMENAPEFFARAGEGRTLDVPHKIIYFDHNGTIYRIMYPLNYESAQKIISSFKFTY